MYTQCRFPRITTLFLFLYFSIPLFGQIEQTQILWDNYGVPHIFARNNKEMYYAFGWSQMNNHANLLLQIYGQARGRAAGYWGREYEASDRQVLLFNLATKGKNIYEKQSAEYKSYVDAFAQGINDYARKHPESVSQEMKRVLPVTGADVFANFVRTAFRFLTATEREATERAFQPGSNAYAIAPSRSTSGNAMLVINPHLPWKPDFTSLFEADLNTPTMHVYGATPVGMPLLFLAFNDYLGWAHTTNTLDASDRYELTTQEDRYLLDDSLIPFDRRMATIHIRQPDGTVREEKFEIKSSRHGPIVGEKGNKAYAVRVAGLDNDKVFEQYHKMMFSKNFAEFESALKMMQIPFFNIVYADRDGNIFYLFNGSLPKRAEGNFAFWRRTIDGTKSKLIWTETLSYDELPKVLNPPSGFLQNANDPPWTCTYPPVLDVRKFPSYVAPLNMGFRAQRAVNMVKSDSAISFDELIAYKLNTRVETADRFLDDLFAAAEKFPDSIASKAVAILKAWDRITDAASKGGVLFSSWFQKLTPAMYAKRWNPEQPLSTPDGLQDEKQAVTLLIEATKEVEQKYGSAAVAWGDVYRLRIDTLNLPSSGGWPEQGIFMSLSYSGDKDNRYVATGGETFIAVTEFAKAVQSKVLLPYGNASQPQSKHKMDQLQLFSQKKLRTALLSKKEILNNLERKESLKIPF